MSPRPFNCNLIPAGSRMLVPRNLQQRLYPPTEFNRCLEDEKGIWQQIQRCGGLMSICPGKKYNDPPWVKMPQQGKRFSYINSIPLPGPPFTGTDTLVTSFRVPLGYDGCIVSVVQNYTGQGFQEGDGDLTWRLQLNQRWVKNYGNTTTSIGSLITPYNINSGQIILLSGQLVQYFVNVATTANLNGGRVIAACLGWWWPR
jgi:hypothetical protein